MSTKPDMSQTSSNNPWKLWVEKTVLGFPSPTLSDRCLSISSSNTRSPPMTERSYNNSSNKNNYIVPTHDQIELVMSDPIRCFCGKPAHKSYTFEYGPIFECGTFATEQTDKQDTKFICGFHIHEISWISFRNLLKAGNTVNSEYSELRTCPQYNFTYCAMFHIKNQYKLDPPTKLPQCFCRRPVTMRIHPKNGIQFACKNAFVDGARKCSWVLNAKDVAFPRPQQRIHNHVDQDKYIARKERQMAQLSGNNTDQKQQQQHKNDLLTALSASMTPSPTSSSIASTIETPKQEKGEIILFEDLVLQEQQLHASYPPISEPWMVPTCVMSNQKKQHLRHQQEKQPLPLPIFSSSTTTSSILPSQSSPPLSPSSQAAYTLKATCHKQQLLIERQKEIIEHQKDKLEQERGINQQAAIKLAHFKEQIAELQTKLLRSRSDQDKETILRMNCQERLSNIEMDVVCLMNEKEKLTEELMIHIEEKNKLGKEEELNKCCLCYAKNIEYCLIPCYHFGKLLFFFFFSWSCLFINRLMLFIK
jgi:hypothetical protein